MRLIIIAAALASFGIASTGFSQPDRPAAGREAAKPFRVELTVAVEGGDKPVVTARTNLPDGTAGVVVLGNPSRNFTTDGIAVTVQQGGFRTSPITDRGAPLAPGFYDLSIIFAGIDQPPAVTAVLGEMGANLVGPNVRNFIGKAVQYEERIAISGGRADPRADADARIRHLIQTLPRNPSIPGSGSCPDLCERARDFSARHHDPFDMFQCMTICRGSQR
jgi:hypothetical protein